MASRGHLDENKEALASSGGSARPEALVNGSPNSRERRMVPMVAPCSSTMQIVRRASFEKSWV